MPRPTRACAWLTAARSENSRLARVTSSSLASVYCASFHLALPRKSSHGGWSTPRAWKAAKASTPCLFTAAMTRRSRSMIAFVQRVVISSLNVLHAACSASV
eukprot:5851251-Prymnesium_polylepis.3